MFLNPTAWINYSSILKNLQILGLQPRISKKVFHTVGQNNFGNKILIFQGSDETGGASFSFGCTFNTHNKTCKYALSQHAHKFEKVSKNGDPNEQSEVAKAVNKLADDVSPFCKIYAPESYKNMIGMYLLRLKRLWKDLLIITHPRANEVEEL